MLLIDFFEVIPINSLLPIRTLKPDKVMFLIDERALETTDARHMQQAVSGIEGVESFTYVPINAMDVNSMKERIRSIVDNSEDRDIYIDLTGGTDLMVASGYSAAMEIGVTPIHIDIANRKAFRVDTLEPLGDLVDISLKDYLKAIGAKQLHGSHWDPTEDERENICGMAEILFRRISEWHALCDKIATAFSMKKGSSSLKFSITDRIEYVNKKGFNPKGLMKEFCRRGFVTYLGDEENETTQPGERIFHYELTKEKYKEYLTVYGIWLEMYVYFKAKPYFDEAYLGLVVDWDNDDELDTVDNEIDVALMKGSIPYFISCKMRKIGASDIYEIGFITSKFGGDYGKSFIATTYPLRKNSKNRGVRSLIFKMENMKVGLISVREEGAFYPLYASQRIGMNLIEDDMES